MRLLHYVCKSKTSGMQYEILIDLTKVMYVDTTFNQQQKSIARLRMVDGSTVVLNITFEYFVQLWEANAQSFQTTTCVVD